MLPQQFDLILVEIELVEDLLVVLGEVLRAVISRKKVFLYLTEI